MTPNEKLAQQATELIRDAYYTAQRDYHNYQDWGSEQWDAIDAALAESKALITAALAAKDKAMAEVVEALDFYADEGNWSDVWYSAGNGDDERDGDIPAQIDFCDCEIRQDTDGDYMGPAGKRARAALAKLRGETV